LLERACILKQDEGRMKEGRMQVTPVPPPPKQDSCLVCSKASKEGWEILGGHEIELDIRNEEF
jgi:hypothetical protein